MTGGGGAWFIGGISGSSLECAINRCYSCGTVSTGYGMSYQINGAYAANNLTSESRFSKDSDGGENSGCSPGKTFLFVLQGDVNNYVEACWPGISIGGGDPRYPLLAWQYEFGGSLPVPGFDDNQW